MSKNFIKESSKPTAGILDNNQMMNLSTNINVLIDPCDVLTQSKIMDELKRLSPLAGWLLDTPLGKQVSNSLLNGILKWSRSVNGLEVELPSTLYTALPKDTVGSCCFAPFDLLKGNMKAEYMYICIKDCDSHFDTMVSSVLSVRQDSVFGKKGTSMAQVKYNIMIMSFLYFISKTMILGTPTTETLYTKPYHGMLHIMEDARTSVIDGSSPLIAFESLGCILEALNHGEVIIALNKITMNSIKSNITIGGDCCTYPAGWTVTEDSVSFKGVTFLVDSNIPVDLDAGTGEAWVMSGIHTGADFLFDVYNPNEVENSIENGDRTKGCAEDCVKLDNIGSVFADNYSDKYIIQDIPLSANCDLNILKKYDDYFNNLTLIPNTVA